MRTTMLLLAVLLGCNRTPPSSGPTGPQEVADETTTVAATPPTDRPADDATPAVVPEPAADAATPVAPEPPSPDDSPTRVRVTATEAAEHGLPAIGCSLDTAGTPLSAGTFSEGDVLLWASGPPGGPQSITVDGCREAPDGEGALERHVRAAFADPRRGPLTVGEPTEVELAGARRAALPFITGASMARTSWCAIAVPDPAGAAQGLVVYAAIGDQRGGPDCTVPLGNQQLARVLATFRLE